MKPKLLPFLNTSNLEIEILSTRVTESAKIFWSTSLLQNVHLQFVLEMQGATHK